MARNRDLFDDTTMTFGEHLEVLRVHVWKALVGVTMGVVVCMFFGPHIIAILKAPVERALRNANIEDIQDDLTKLEKKNFWDFFGSSSTEDDGASVESLAPANAPTSDTIVVRVPAEDIREALRDVAPEMVVPVPPGNAAETGQGSAGKGETKPGSGRHVELTLQGPEIALWNRTADRFNSPTTFRVEEAFMTWLKVTFVAGLVLSSPWVFYQAWQFVAAGLYPHERRYVHVYLPMSLGLFLTGAIFCFYLVFPIVLSFLIGWGKWMGVELQPRLSEYISLVLMVPLMFGVSFQLPLVMLFLERIGVVTVDTYTKNWRMAVLIMAVASMMLTPSDPGSMLLMFVPLLVLYAGGIQLCRMRLTSAPDPLA